MTPVAIYNFKTSKFIEAQRVMYIKDLEGATRSSQSQQLILQFVDECDYLIDFPIANRCGFFTQVRSFARGLFVCPFSLIIFSLPRARNPICTL